MLICALDITTVRENQISPEFYLYEILLNNGLL